MWPYSDFSASGAALRQASAVGAVLSAPFVSLPEAHSGRPAANDRLIIQGDALAAHRLAPVDAAPPSNDDYHGFAGALRHGVAMVRGWFRRRALRETLMNMDTHQLADIGLTRADIEAVAAGRYRRPAR